MMVSGASPPDTPRQLTTFHADPDFPKPSPAGLALHVASMPRSCGRGHDVEVIPPGRAFGILALLVASALAVALAPLLMPPSYSAVSMSISESAAQGVRGAWLARLGFVLEGLAVLWLAREAGGGWGPMAGLLFRLFGVMMFAVALYAHRPFEAGAPADLREDLLHSIAASVMGMAFVVGTLTMAFRRADGRSRITDLAAATLSLALPIAMSVAPALQGAFQRTLFAVGYGWFALETWRVRASPRAR